VIDLSTGDIAIQTSFLIQDAEPNAAMRSRTSLTFAPDSQNLAFVRRTSKHVTVSRDEYPFVSTEPTDVIVWLDAHSGSIRREIEISGSAIGALAFSPDGQAIAATTSSDPSSGVVIRLFRLRDKKEIQRLETWSSGVTAVTFTPAGTQLVAALSDTSIVLWNVHPTQ
jgi:WD40 repeat protein